MKNPQLEQWKGRFPSHTISSKEIEAGQHLLCNFELRYPRRWRSNSQRIGLSITSVLVGATRKNTIK
ncbi:uncharacterized protein VTP21DRAFT_4308 [Calcarisporiella thermophila]|uniref:uncharacterized protein n=1 Tax=Calcarisporiella thermophila TaxID=911321 RepID=UPI00374278D9